MKKALLLLLLPVVAKAQISVQYTVYPSTIRHSISPNIYGMCNGGYDDATIRRMGGNRMTGYNWENNASHAGADYFHQNDNYIPWVMGIPSVNYDVPGIALRAFHDSAQAHQALTALTLPMAGYVAHDKSGTSVQVSEAAPGSRWDQVYNTKPGPFSLNPDLNDGRIYVDETINFLQSHYGNSSAATGVKAFIMDNEAGLWTSTHPRIYTGVISCTDHLTKSLALARRIREMDATVAIWGPESYGYSEYYDFQGSGDWSTYSGNYSRYLELYLDSMRVASQLVGDRLLDVMTVHWYPDVYAGSIYSSNVSANIAQERMQVPRSLWDSTYIENGWIGEWFSQDLPILPRLKKMISDYFPGTQLGITEYDYGADGHISGGIAEVEALGAFAKTGTEIATKWGEFSDYSLSAIQLYRNVEHPFGDHYVASSCTDLDNSGLFTSINGVTDNELHLVVTNKNTTTAISATFDLIGASNYDSLFVYWFSDGSPQLQSVLAPEQTLQPNGFSYTLQPLSAYHFVLKRNDPVNAVEQLNDNQWTCSPNPAENELTIQWKSAYSGKLLLLSTDGRILQSYQLTTPQQSFQLSLDNLVHGVYILQLNNGEKKYIVH